MRKLILGIVLFALMNCAGVKEVTIEKRAIDCTLRLFRYTGKTYFAGHGGFFIREQSNYIILLPDHSDLISYDKIRIEKDGKLINPNGGNIEFLHNRCVVISLTEELEGRTVNMEINGIFKIKNKKVKSDY